MLKCKTAVVTGGNKGIGKAISLDLAENGANIAIIYGGDTVSAEEACKQVQALGVKCRIYQCDISQFEAVKLTIEKILADFTRVDILVNNAGITRDNLMLGMKKEDFDAVIDVNLKSVFNTTKNLYRHFITNRSGRIINVSSIVGIDGNAGQTNYAASKAGIIGMTKSLSKELAARNITCNVVAPGFIQTAMTEKLSDEQKKIIAERIPLKRLGIGEDVAKAVTFLAGESADYITGQVIRVDGGLTI